MTGLVLPDDSRRMTILGHTGFGKTVAAAWQLSLRSFDTMPWIIVDTKGDKLLNRIGAKEIATGHLPTRPGLYITHPLPDEKDEVEAMLWQAYNKRVADVKQRKHNSTGIGFLFDEGYYITGSSAYRAILTRGRSLTIPCITCSQRPVWLDRFVFSESDYFQVFWLIDARDRKTIQSFMPFDTNERLPDYHSIWYDVSKDRVIRLAPVPSEQDIIRAFRERTGKRRQAI